MAERRVHLYGEVHNLLRSELVLVDRNNQPRMCFPVERTAQIEWTDPDYPGEARFIQSPDLHPCIPEKTEVVGWLNDGIGLVRPTTHEGLLRLREFWYKNTKTRQARLKNFPDLAAEPRNTARPNFYVVTCGVVWVAHCHNIPLHHLLVPAGTHCGTMMSQSELRYEALMPARYLVREATK